MAQRRMFSLKIVDSDAFLDMPQSSQLLYFHLSMRADDDGFIGNPKKIMRMVGNSDDDMKILLAKRFLLPFDSGIVVIKHWKIHNYIQNDRYSSTQYLEEKKQLKTKDNGAYTENVSKMDTQVRLELGKDRLIGETDVSQKRVTGKKKTLNMAWKKYNENAHEDELPSVGDDGEIAKEKPRTNHVCYQVFTTFKDILGIYPLNWNVNKSQRIACENLVQERGMEQIVKALEFYEDNKDKEFCPSILSPWDLDTKWKKLIEFKDKQ